MIELRMAPGLAAAGALLAVKQVAMDHPGEHALRLLIETTGRAPLVRYPPGGVSRLTLGPEWTYSGDEACLAALAEFGTEPPKVVP